MLRDPNESIDIAGANRYGQQLFLADLFFRRGARRPEPAAVPAVQPLPLERVRPRWWQPTLVTRPVDLAAHGRPGIPDPPDARLAAALYQRARELGAEQGWSERLTVNTCHGLRIILGTHDTPGGTVKASHVAQLRGIDLPIWTVLRVLDDARMLDEDRTTALDAWFTRQIEDLPEPVADELRTWFEIMKNGSPVPPRRKPRSETTIRIHLTWALPILHTWAAAGHRSLREITKEHVLDALPAAGNPRSTAGRGLRSVFQLLKARKVLFVDPTRRVKTGEHTSRQPVPANLEAIRAALLGDDPLRAALVALIAFHGLRTGHLCRLRLTDVHDGRLHVDGRVIVLASPVRERLTAWLTHRNRRWPTTGNPYLFAHFRTVGRTEPVGRRWIWLHLGPGLSAAALREDRILNEAQATGGDLRRLADLFGLSIEAGARYAATLDHPDLVRLDPPEVTNPGAT
jgi:integrase